MKDKNTYKDTNTYKVGNLNVNISSSFSDRINLSDLLFTIVNTKLKEKAI